MTADLSGHAACYALGRVLRGEVSPSELPTIQEPALRRVVNLGQCRRQPSPLDRAVLVRQALRFCALQHGQSSARQLIAADSEHLPTFQDWMRVGVDATPSGWYLTLTARPWCPVWLPGLGDYGADGASGEHERRTDSAVPGDPFLARFRRQEYRSAGQRAAIRAALSTPPGGTLLVCLPTGDGKSFVFQCVSEVGFGDVRASELPGVTLVVTPTVALAQDHELAARELGLDDVPRAYVGGNAFQNSSIRERVADGTQGLVFASPEAVCTGLRPALVTAAEHGYLRALVVDEAHLVDAWGAEFRPEFQLLSGIRRELLATSGGVLRTFLLSATYTQAAVRTMRAFFSHDVDGQPSPFAVVAAARLRPEPEYWVAPVTWDEDRERRVIEAALHVPRPAILYTTTVDDANRWFNRLKQEGFSRLACVTGRSPADERNRAVRDWRTDELDLVVATSAFGLGIDNAHVRAVVHACIPETLDRYYQEVGRGGRDGGASSSLVIPAQSDFSMATSLNQTKVISVDVGLRRWRSMFHHRERLDHGDDEYTVRLDVPPGVDARSIDMDNQENTEWNQRTLTLMTGAGLLSLVGPVTTTPRYGRDAEPGDFTDGAAPTGHAYQTVKILDSGHADEQTWREVVEARRRLISAANRESLHAITAFVRNPERNCIAEILAPLYTVSDEAGRPLIQTAKSCGGCPSCRVAGKPPFVDALSEPRLPWPATVDVCPPADSVIDQARRCLVFYTTDELELRGMPRRFRQALAALVRSGFHNLVGLDTFDIDRAALLREIGRVPLFVAGRWINHRLPPGPTVVLAGADTRLTCSMWSPPSPGEARIAILPADAADPDLPDVPLRERHVGRTLTLVEFVERLTA